MQVGVTGVSGFIGSYIAAHLKRAGHTVVGLVRETSKRSHIADSIDRFVVGTQEEDTWWDSFLDETDCVISNSISWSPLKMGGGKPTLDLNAHLQTNLVNTLRFLEASAPRQFIFMSTIAVHNQMRPRWDGLVDEDHPLRPNTFYGAYKASIEAHLWSDYLSTGRSVCSFRPCGVYGIDPSLKRSYGYGIINRVRKGKAIRKPGGGKFIHVEDVAAAVSAAVGNDATAGQVYNLVDCYARWADWARITCDILDTEVEIDESSPCEPQNTFTKDAVRTLGVDPSRGHDGIRQVISALIERM